MEFLDISGRRSTELYSPKPTSFAARLAQRVKVLDILRVVAKWYIVKSQHMAKWAAQISEADAVVIGGGQLLMDNSLDFPLKVNMIARLAYSLNRDVHFLSCGVGRKWSRIASRLFYNALVSASSITVRDTISQERLANFLPGLVVSLSADPAIWASDIYGQKRAMIDDLIGLGIMQVPMSSFQTHTKLFRDRLIDFWLSVANRLYRDGDHFELFTNGSLQDQALALSIVEAIKERLSISCNLVSRPTKPCELAQSISRYRAIIASRLHAHIIATSYNIPSVGLLWDDKVQAFFKDIGRESFVLGKIETEDADNIIRALHQSIDEPINEIAVMKKRELVFENVKAILNTIGLT